MLRKILCLLGFHTWNYYNEHRSTIDNSTFCKNRECIKCGRIEENAYDFMESYWTKG